MIKDAVLTNFKVLCGLEKMWMDVFTTNLRYYMHCNTSERMLSWTNLTWYVDRNRCERMLSWPNLKCNVNWKGCDRKISRQIWGNIWIRTDVKICCLDKIEVLFWLKKMWLEAFTTNFRFYVDCIRCGMMLSWPNLRWYVYWKRLNGRYHDQFQVLCGLEQIIKDDVMT
jgi:hypothetical protein